MQIQALASMLLIPVAAGELEMPDAILHSPAHRCAETAAILAKSFRSPTTSDGRLAAGRVGGALGLIHDWVMKVSAATPVKEGRADGETSCLWMVTHEDVVLAVLDRLQPQTDSVTLAPRASAWLIRRTLAGWAADFLVAPTA